MTRGGATLLALCVMLSAWLTYKLITEQDRTMTLTDKKNALEAQVNELQQDVNNYKKALADIRDELQKIKKERDDLQTAVKLEYKKRQIQHQRIESVVKKNMDGQKEIKSLLDSLIIINLEELQKGPLQ